MELSVVGDEKKHASTLHTVKGKHGNWKLSLLFLQISFFLLFFFFRFLIVS